MKVLMIDNYDSFTYNIVQYFGELGAEVQVFRNDEITVEGIADHAPDRLVISPGPCSPAEAGISVAAIQHFMGKLPILGVCLGHQCLAQVCGGQVVRAGLEGGVRRRLAPYGLAAARFRLLPKFVLPASGHKVLSPWRARRCRTPRR